MTISPATLARYGQPGDPIAGSNFVRAYCCVCGEPIRVALGNAVDFVECQDCRGALPRKVLNQQRALRNQCGPALRAGQPGFTTEAQRPRGAGP